jgi:cytochrome c peroxidase
MFKKHTFWQIKKSNILLGFLVFIIMCSFFQKKENHTSSANYILVFTHTKNIIKELQNSINCVDTFNVSNLKKLKTSYFSARAIYKEIENCIEYQSPFDVKYFINGPLVKKAELEYGSRTFDPHGFQVIEELLFSGDTIDFAKLKNEYLFLNQAFEAYIKKIERSFIGDSQLLESLQFEFIRLMSLSLNGYDATFTKTNIDETISALKGSQLFLNNIKKNYPTNLYPNTTHQKTILAINAAIIYCRLHKDYDSFDRLFFITRHLNPIYKLISELHQNKLFPHTPVNYAVDLKKVNPFNLNSFNDNYFSVSVNDTLNKEPQVELGKLLFFDPVLSGNNQRACASCHKPELGFTDGLQKALEFETKDNLNRNTPTLLNVFYQKNFFHDGRSRQLVEQINEVLHNKQEMNTTIEEIILKLNQSEEYKALFKNAFIGTADSSISYFGVLKSIHEYERTLVSKNTKFDKYLEGDYTQLNTNEINGYNVFSGKALCGSCHFFPLFNGLVPPIYNDTEYEVIGVPKEKNSLEIDGDEGRKIISKNRIHQFAFKTPTVRNIELTPPYMHNGIYKTLEEVIDFYNKGGGNGIGINISHQTLPFDSLQLTKQEIRDIKAFMLSLTDTTNLTRKPKKLPHFKDEKLNHRMVGGEY